MLQLWTDLDPQSRILVVGVLIKLAVSGIRKFTSQIDGRYVHYLALALSVAAMLVDAVVQGGTNSPYASMIAEFCASALVALGVNEAVRPVLGKDRDAAREAAAQAVKDAVIAKALKVLENRKNN